MLQYVVLNSFFIVCFGYVYIKEMQKYTQIICIHVVKFEEKIDLIINYVK